jgi:hypothetical protein
VIVRRLRPRTRPRTGTALVVAATVATLAALVSGATGGLAAPFTTSSTLPNLGSGKVWSLAVSPNDANVVLAGTDAGVYRSADGGATWAQTSIKGTRAWTIGFDARAPHTAYTGLSGRGVARSDDGGTTWVDSSTGLTDRDVRCLAFGLEGIAAGTANGVDVSPDGQHWRTAGLDGYSVSSLVVSANQPQLTLVAGIDAIPPGATGSGFLFRNNGGALKWDALQQGLPTATVVSSVAAGPLPATGQARPLLVTTAKGVYHSGDGGNTWTSSTGIPDQTNLTVSTFSPLDPNLVYAGADAGGSSGGVLMRSTDSGASFTAVADALPDGQRNVDAIAVGQSTPPTVLVGVDPPSGAAAVYRGADSGAPAPGATATDTAGAALSNAVPTPKPTPHPKTTPHHALPPAQSTGIRHVAEVAVRFPFPLVLEVLAILTIVYLVMRWRQRYLDVEGPP